MHLSNWPFKGPFPDHWYRILELKKLEIISGHIKCTRTFADRLACFISTCFSQQNWAIIWLGTNFGPRGRSSPTLWITFIWSLPAFWEPNSLNAGTDPFILPTWRQQLFVHNSRFDYKSIGKKSAEWGPIVIFSSDCGSLSAKDTWKRKKQAHARGKLD